MKAAITAVQGVLLLDGFVEEPHALYDCVHADAVWDESFASRKTACFGAPYNYKPVAYPEVSMPEYFLPLCARVQRSFGFLPNSCLVNFFPDGRSRLGYHYDDNPHEGGAGVCILSLGAPRVIRFKSVKEVHDFLLPDGSALFMARSVQPTWKRCVPSVTSSGPRLSLVFRQLVPLPQLSGNPS